jgi:lambda repressor-like predicted transcriptional regulator
VALSVADVNYITKALKCKYRISGSKVDLQPEKPIPDSYGYNERVITKIHQQQKYLNDEEIDKIIAGYKSGQTLRALAKQFDSHRITISRKLKAAGIKLRYESPSDSQIDEMVQQYESGLSMAKVGKQFGFAASSVLMYLRKRGIKTRDPHGN